MTEPQNARVLSSDDQARIRTAVREAEQRTSGEIVPYLVYQSDSYEVALWRGAAAGSIFTMMGLLLVYLWYGGWDSAWIFGGWAVVFWISLGGTIGGVCTQTIPAVRRWLAGSSKADRVHQRAMMAFVEEEVFLTRDRTGILLFISLFEHRIEVLGDSGINAKVSPADWNAVVKKIKKGIRRNDLAGGLVDAILMCGELLERKEVVIKSDDQNELSDEIRIREK